MKIRNNHIGVTLVELLLATAILVFTSVTIIRFYLTTISLSEINKEETTAMADLTSITEAVKSTPFSNIVASFPNWVYDGPAGNSYATIVGGYLLTNEHIVVSYINPNSDPLEINISLSWQDRRGVNRTRNLVTKRTK